MSKKIFVSVGTRFKMDRLIRLVDKFVASNPSYSAVAQTGDTDQQFDNIKVHNFIAETSFTDLVKDADIYISHAGMGNILTAVELQKPIIIMPRRLKYKEHVNDHQLDTVSAFSNRDYIYAIENMDQLTVAAEHVLSNSNYQFDSSNNDLTAAITQFINN